MIRKIWLALALAAVVAAPSAVQGQTVLGLRAGVNVANVEGDDVLVNTDSKTGLVLGGSASIPLSNSVGLTLGALYSQKGTKFTPDDSDAEVTLSLDYIEIPALLSLSFQSDGALGGRFFAGPALGIEVGCEAEASSQGVELSADCDAADLDIDTKAFDFGGVGGAGVTWDTSGGMQLSLDAFYNFGLTSFVDDDETEAKNRTFSIQAGVGFPL